MIRSPAADNAIRPRLRDLWILPRRQHDPHPTVANHALHAARRGRDFDERAVKGDFATIGKQRKGLGPLPGGIRAVGGLVKEQVES